MRISDWSSDVCSSDLRLGAAAQAGGEEALGHRVEGRVVFRTGEAVAFVGEQHVGHRDALGLHRLDDLVALGLHHARIVGALKSEEHTSELQSLMRISYAVFCLKKKNNKKNIQ